MGADQYDQKHYSKARGTSTWPIQKTAVWSTVAVRGKISANRLRLLKWNSLHLKHRRRQWVAFLTPGVERQCYFKVGWCNLYVFRMAALMATASKVGHTSLRLWVSLGLAEEMMLDATRAALSAAQTGRRPTHELPPPQLPTTYPWSRLSRMVPE